MACNNCGRQTPNPRLCSDCARHQHLDRRDDPEPEYYTCPDCGGHTSGRDAVCADCREVAP